MNSFYSGQVFSTNRIMLMIKSSRLGSTLFATIRQGENTPAHDFQSFEYSRKKFYKIDPWCRESNFALG